MRAPATNMVRRNWAVKIVMVPAPIRIFLVIFFDEFSSIFSMSFRAISPYKILSFLTLIQL